MSGGLKGGGYLLFHFRSIIGVARFNFSVRNGKRWSPCAIATLVRLHSPKGERRAWKGVGSGACPKAAATLELLFRQVF